MAKKFGLNGRINMLCVEAFFKLSKVLPFEESVAILKKQVEKQFAHKGEMVIQQNKVQIFVSVAPISSQIFVSVVPFVVPM